MIELLLFVAFIGFVAYMVGIAPYIHQFFKALIIGVLCFIALIVVLDNIGITHIHHLVIR